MSSKSTQVNINRAIRQETLREQLSAKGLVQHVLEISEKLSNEEVELEPLQVQRLKHAADLQLKLISKYLPDLKGVELTGANGENLGGLFKVQLVKPDAK